MTIPDELIARTVFSCQDARSVGVTTRQLQTALRAGALHQVRRGWCSATKPEWSVTAHRQRLQVALAEPPALMASHHSAAILHGLPIHRPPLRQVHLQRLGPGLSSYRDCVVIHQARESVRPHPQLRAVDLAAAVVQTALLDPLSGLMSADRLLATDPGAQDRIEAVLHAYRSARGIVLARAALALADPRHESPGESHTVYVLHGLGWEIEPQFEVRCGSKVFRLDGRLIVPGRPDAKIAVEHDGRDKYAQIDGRGQTKADVAALLAEKGREDDLRSLGWQFIRVTRERLQVPSNLMVVVDRAVLADARRLRQDRQDGVLVGSVW